MPVFINTSHHLPTPAFPRGEQVESHLASDRTTVPVSDCSRRTRYNCVKPVLAVFKADINIIRHPLEQHNLIAQLAELSRQHAPLGPRKIQWLSLPLYRSAFSTHPWVQKHRHACPISSPTVYPSAGSFATAASTFLTVSERSSTLPSFTSTTAP